MGVLPTPVPTTGNSSCFERAIARFSPPLPLLVAYSGGADSTALLLACQQKWPGQVVAAHIHHGLQAAADGFVQHCEQVCRQWEIPLEVRRLNAHHAKGQSPEDAARKARYQALAQVARARGVTAIALAQHQDDQVETLLLALSRGAGLPGLSAMPAQGQRPESPGLLYFRPLLDVPGAQLRQWLAQHHHCFVEDPSNNHTAYTRNRIRHQLIPALAHCFPGYRDTFTRSIRHIAQAQTLLLELAEQDLALVGVPPAINALQALSSARQANVLRHWLRQEGAMAPSARQLAQLQNQITACTTRGHGIELKVGQGQVVRKGLVLHWYNP